MNPRIAIRFWAKVDDTAPGNSCWPYKGCKNAHGYGEFMAYSRRRAVLAHRMAYQLVKGPIPDGAFVLHRCDNPSCCRPSHLFIGSQKDNVDDMVSKGRQQRGVKSGRAKLSNESIFEIRRRCASGESRKALATEFGVRACTISQIHTRTIWRHL